MKLWIALMTSISSWAGLVVGSLCGSLVFANSIPMYDLPLLNGTQSTDIYRMSDHPNSVFVFEAYKVSCGACNQNAEFVKALATEMKGNSRVQILDLSLDYTTDQFELWISRHHPDHPVVRDLDFKVYRSLRTDSSGVPQVFVVNCRGELLGNLSGIWDSGAREKIRRMIDEGLKENCE